MDKLRKLLLPVLAAIFLIGNFSPFLQTASAWDAPAWDLDKEQKEQKEVPEGWKEEHEEEFSEEGEKPDYVDMSLWELLASPEEMKAYIKRLKNNLAQLPADVYDYIHFGEAGAELQQWFKEATDYISNGGLLNDLKEIASFESVKEFRKLLITKEFYTGLANDMTVGMLEDIEAFAIGTDPQTGKKINLPNRLDKLAQTIVKPEKIFKKVKALDPIMEKLSIKKLDGKSSKKGQPRYMNKKKAILLIEELHPLMQ